MNLSSNMYIILTFITLLIFVLFIAIIKENLYQKYLDKISKVDSEVFLPKDELNYLKQIFYLLMGAIAILSLIIFYLGSDPNFIDINYLDIVVSIIAIIYIADKRPFNFILAILLIPTHSIVWILGITDVNLLILIFHWMHITGVVLSAYFFFKRFLKYTKSNNLGYTVLIFIGILSIGLLVTAFYEQTSFLNSVVMISNAFTSNGYTVLGKSFGGKVVSILLVWGGYLLSGVGTATLAAAIITAYLKGKITDQEHKINELSDELKSKDEKLDLLLDEIKDLKELVKK